MCIRILSCRQATFFFEYIVNHIIITIVAEQNSLDLLFCVFSSNLCHSYTYTHYLFNYNLLI